MDKQVKCSCGGRAIAKVRDIKLKQTPATIRGVHYYECKKCGEKFSTSEQMHELDGKIKELRMEIAKARA